LLQPLRPHAADIDRRLLRLIPASPVRFAPLGFPPAATRRVVARTWEDVEPADEPVPLRLPSRPSVLPAAASRPAARRRAGLAALRAARDTWSRALALQDLVAERP